MKAATIRKGEADMHRPVVTGSIPVADATSLKYAIIEQGTTQNRQAYLATASEQGNSVSRAPNLALSLQLYTYNTLHQLTTILQLHQA